MAAYNPITTTIGTVQDGVADYGNLRNAGFSRSGAVLTAIGSTLGDAVGLGDGGLYDAYEGRSQSGRQLSTTERVFAGASGGLQLVTAGVGGAKVVTSAAGGLAGVFGKSATRAGDKIDDLVAGSKPSQRDLADIPKKPAVPIPRSQQLAEAAERAGFKKTNFRSHGQPVYKKGNVYISPDIDVHNGGAFKAADSVKNLRNKNTRLGTFDENLNRTGD